MGEARKRAERRAKARRSAPPANPPRPALSAAVVPYSSVVGSSVAIITDDGRQVAQLAIMLPGLPDDSPEDRRKAAEGLSQRIAFLWNSAEAPR